MNVGGVGHLVELPCQQLGLFLVAGIGEGVIEALGSWDRLV
jgi:hypothetical protein